MKKGTYQHSEEVKKRIGRAAMNPSQETIEKRVRASALRMEETRKKLSNKFKGRKITWGNKISKARKGKGLGQMPWNKGLEGFRGGENHHNWKGGVTPINAKIRKSLEYKLWRESVFERDHYTCVWCGDKQRKGHSVILNADHIKPFAFFPELRFAIDNGRTLCVPCHKTTDTYGAKAEEYKNRYGN